ncbi:MAG: hypothetical protein ACHQF4_07065 [Sphingobacteriales bacterium]
MKKMILKSKNLTWVLSALMVFGFASCRKTNSLSFTPGTGAPIITSVHTLSKTDTSKVPRVITAIDANGNITLDTVGYPINPAAFDSVTTNGNKQSYYVIYGANLGSTTNITFNGVVAYFNRALITDKSLIVSIPTSVPTVGSGATNKLVVTTLHGSVTYSFVTLTPVPTVTDVSDYDFWSGSQITLSGFGFATVTSVGMVGSTATCSIVSQSDGQLTIKFPSGIAINRTNLLLTYVYNSAGNTKVATSIQEFNDLDNAYTIFFNNNFQNAWGDASWQAPSGVSTAASHSGTSSLVATYPSNGWKIEGWANWYPSFAYDASYKYLTFWVKGGTQAQILTLVGDQVAGGYGQNGSPAAIQQINVPPGVWTFYKIPLGTGSGQLNFWAGGTVAKQLGFFLKGQNSDPDETMYFDEVAFLK